MKHGLRIDLGRVCIALLLVGATGCATTGTTRDTAMEHGAPTAPARADGRSEIPPASVPQRPLEALLGDASEALRLANEAQELGDPAEARKQYTLMLELLIEADLDPEVFYAMREPLGSIVDTSARQIALYPHTDPEVPALDGIVYTEPGGVPIPQPLPYRVARELERIQEGYPAQFQRGLDRSRQYMPYIEAEFEKAGLPKDLAWLAIVESNFWPTAVSRASAGGMWQFMKGTALQYKLRVDGHADAWVDERFDWQSATHAAIAYLSFLRDTFDGDWALAVTAYNIGEGALERAIAANGGQRNLWALLETPPASNQIHLEGKQYYAKFLASLIIARDPEAYGFTMAPAPAADAVQVPVRGIYRLEELDKELGYETGTLAKLNPDLLKGMTPPEHTGAYKVTVPESDRRRFQTALRRVPTVKHGNTTHRVARGETFSGIANRYGVSWRELMRLNGHSSDRTLAAGQVLRIPGPGTVVAAAETPAAPAPATAAPAPAPAPAPASVATHTVRRGDTLFDIAKAHNVSVKDLQTWNDMGNSSRLHAGQKLEIRSGGTAGAGTVAAAPKHHVVRANEYPQKIANQYGISLSDFLKWNNLDARSTILVGQRVVVGAAGGGAAQVAEAAPAERKIVHLVKRGDTAGGIAQQHGVALRELLAWNNLTTRSTLRVGDQLVVHLPAGGAVAASSEREPAKQIHVVQRGQNPTTIARAHGVGVDDLLNWNNLSRNHVLRVGDEVVVYKD